MLRSVGGRGDSHQLTKGPGIHHGVPRLESAQRHQQRLLKATWKLQPTARLGRVELASLAKRGLVHEGTLVAGLGATVCVYADAMDLEVDPQVAQAQAKA